MSKEEQETFVVFFNTFKISRKLDTFADLYDGKALFEVGRPIAGLADAHRSWLLCKLTDRCT